MEYFINFLPFIGIISLVVILMVVSHVSENSPFYFYDLLCDSKTGKASVEKILVLIAGLAITIWFMQTASDGKATVSDVLAYGGLMGLAKIVKDVIASKDNAAVKPPGVF